MSEKVLVFKRSGEIIRISLDKFLENRRWWLRKHDEVSEDFKRNPGEIDRVIGCLVYYPDLDNPFAFKVICPICGWTSNITHAYSRFRFINRVTSILGKHLKKKHGFYEVVEKLGAGTHWEQVYRCKICGHIEDRLWDILAHYINKHMKNS